MKLQLFSFIDQVIDYKDSLRFEIDEAKKALDTAFLTAFQKRDYFINYTSRIKTDESLSEKIIRQNYAKRFKDPETMFHDISDIIGCRLECRFNSDEKLIYQELFTHFHPTDTDFYQYDLDPRIQLDLTSPQPKSQKNGIYSYRIDGRFLGTPVLNFELQIKSIVNVFWNEIDHKILYKNYNYVVTEDFVREIMASIKGDLNNIDTQLEMVYRHLLSLDNDTSESTDTAIQYTLGRLIQDAYVLPIREERGVIFDFRPATDLLTEFLMARVKYESRESYGEEFIRIMEEASKAKHETTHFGDLIAFDPPVAYHDQITQQLGERLEEIVNIDIIWNLLIHIVLDLNPNQEPAKIYRTFIDYLYFCLIKTVRDSLETAGYQASDYDSYIDQVVAYILDDIMRDPEPEDFTEKRLDQMEACLTQFFKTADLEAEDRLEALAARYPTRKSLAYWEHDTAPEEEADTEAEDEKPAAPVPQPEVVASPVWKGLL